MDRAAVFFCAGRWRRSEQRNVTRSGNLPAWIKRQACSTNASMGRQRCLFAQSLSGLAEAQCLTRKGRVRPHRCATWSPPWSYHLAGFFLRGLRAIPSVKHSMPERSCRPRSKSRSIACRSFHHPPGVVRRGVPDLRDGNEQRLHSGGRHFDLLCRLCQPDCLPAHDSGIELLWQFRKGQPIALR